jgi:hypothetical protein
VAIAQVRLDPGQPGTQADRIGERVLVRFEHGARPLAWQAARAVRQQVLRHLTTGSR